MEIKCKRYSVKEREADPEANTLHAWLLALMHDILQTCNISHKCFWMFKADISDAVRVSGVKLREPGGIRTAGTP